MTPEKLLIYRRSSSSPSKELKWLTKKVASFEKLRQVQREKGLHGRSLSDPEDHNN